MPRHLVASLVLVVALAGCLGDDEPSTDRGIHGTVVRRSDVEGTADEPVSTGAVVVVPAARAGELWEHAGFGPDGPEQPRTAEFELDRPALPDGGEIADLRPDGSFATSVEPQEGWLCLADALPGDDPGPPFRVSGCTELTPDRSGRVDIAVVRGGTPRATRSSLPFMA